MGVERRRHFGCAKLEMTSYAVFLCETTAMWICITLPLLQYNSSEYDVNQVCLASPPCRSSSDMHTPDDVHCRVETIEPGIELRGSLLSRDDRAGDRAAGRGSLPSRDDRAAGRGSRENSPVHCL